MYSSLVTGIHAVQLSQGNVNFEVHRAIRPGDFMLKMYHVPVNQRGRNVLDCRLHTSILQSRIVNDEEKGMITLRVDQGDFDSISYTLSPPSDFTIQVIITYFLKHF